MALTPEKIAELRGRAFRKIYEKDPDSNADLYPSTGQKTYQVKELFKEAKATEEEVEKYSKEIMDRYNVLLQRAGGEALEEQKRQDRIAAGQRGENREGPAGDGGASAAQAGQTEEQKKGLAEIKKMQADTSAPQESPETKAELAKENRLSEQAALMLTIDQILPKISKTGEAAQTSSEEGPAQYNRVYKNFTTVRYNKDLSSTPTGHFFITKNFTKTNDTEELFKNIPPQVMSLLVPSIKMYKTFYPVSFMDKDKKVSIPPDQSNVVGYDWRIPFDDVPVAFGNKTSEFVAKNIDDILSGGKLHAIGIKSFSYEYKGTNPAEINTNIEATMDIFFQSPEDLVKEIPINFKKDPRFQNKVPDGNYEPASFSYSDLINQTSKYIKDAAYGEYYNADYYRLKIECGYADVDENILRDVLINSHYTIPSCEKIIKAIKASNVSFYLTPYRYDVNFNDDGTINLKIDFIASMDAAMTSQEADLFAITDETRSLLEMIKKYDNYFANKKQSTNESETGYVCKTPEQVKKDIQEFKDKYPNYKNLTDEEIESQLFWTRKNVYNAIFNYLVGTETLKGIDNPLSIKPRVYAALYKPQILGIKSSQEDDTSTERRLEALSAANQLIDIVPIEQVEQTLIEGEQSKSEDQADIATKSLDEKIIERVGEGQEIYRIKFILLGDILDVALECLNNIQPISFSPKIVIGGIPLSIPTKIKEKLNKFNIITDLVEINPNLADIPISFDLFQQFMIEHVVRPKKERYPILQFIKDIISDLIIPSISPTVFSLSSAINSSIRFSTHYETIPVYGDVDQLSGLNIEQRNFIPIINKSIVDNLSVHREYSGYKPEKLSNYMFLTCTSRFPKNFSGDEEKDRKEGVMHIRMGTDSGLVKKISFKKANTLFLREMVARREGNSRGTTIKQVYNAEVYLYGNNIFRPGDYVYIHPNYMFSTKMIDLEDKLGVGGYYLVTKVKTDISDMSFNTVLTCTFQAHVLREGNKKIVKPINDTCSRATT